MNHIQHNGRSLSIAHLAPTTFGCPCRELGRDLVIGADFSNHCYTERFDSERHSREEIVVYESPSRPRAFCLERYELSHRLPAIVAELPNKRVHQTPEKRNYVYAVPLQIEGRMYEVYFMLQRAETSKDLDLRLTVESAYAVTMPSPVPRRPNAIRFGVLAYKVLRREQVRFAAR